MSDLMNSLSRLERAGSNSSRCTEKLHEAASAVAGNICKIIANAKAVGVDLPRHYRVIKVKSNVGSARYLVLENGDGSYLYCDFHAWIPEQTRDGSLQFAKDISEGLLTEIAEFLEKRASEEAKATDLLG